MPADERFYLRYFTILKRHTEEKKKKKKVPYSRVQRIRNGISTHTLLDDDINFPFTGKGTINYFFSGKVPLG